MKLYDGSHPEVDMPRVAERPGFYCVVYYHAVMPNKLRARYIRDGYPEPSAPEGWIKITPQA